MCGCTKRTSQQYLWTSADGKSTQQYPNKIMADAKVMRVGGTVTPLTTATASA